MIRFCLASASRSALGLLKRPRRERYNSADIFTRYRHEDASTIMSEPAISATGASSPIRRRPQPPAAERRFRTFTFCHENVRFDPLAVPDGSAGVGLSPG